MLRGVKIIVQPNEGRQAFDEKHLIGAMVSFRETASGPPPPLFSLADSRREGELGGGRSGGTCLAPDASKSYGGATPYGVVQEPTAPRAPPPRPPPSPPPQTDMVMLSLVDVLLTSSFSTFGYVGAALRPRPMVWVHWHNPWQKGGGGSFVRSENTEPCEHFYKTYCHLDAEEPSVCPSGGNATAGMMRAFVDRLVC